MQRNTPLMPDNALPHWNERPPSAAITTLLIHSISAPQRANAYDPAACIELLDLHRVAAHYLIDREGRIRPLVLEEHRAWHAGESKLPDSLGGTRGVNDFSIGVELIGADTEPFTSQQYQSLAALTAEIQARHPLQAVLGHQHVAEPPGRKTDPGPQFDWERLRAEALQFSGATAGLRFPQDL
ncbi:MAG: N-acetylmuramoyl-L-alanine amidase [Bdellovibrionales bacterium]|nr:N-acetylmuramoyl-L-alanine amidase [Bdellovibrionales bacterium]